MSNTDSFIDEVTEEVRRDKLFALMRRYGWIAILGVVALVGGAAYVEWQKHLGRLSAQDFGDAVVAALETDTPEARATALDAIVAQGEQQAVLRFLQAGAAVERGDTAAALATFAALAADQGLPDSYRQLASLKRILLAGADLPPEERAAALEALARPGAPFRPLALEQQAVVRIEAGKTDEAVALLRQVLQEPGLTAAMRRRVTDLMAALGADPEAAAG